jgi:hypothetical protein
MMVEKWYITTSVGGNAYVKQIGSFNGSRINKWDGNIAKSTVTFSAAVTQLFHKMEMVMSPKQLKTYGPARGDGGG